MGEVKEPYVPLSLTDAMCAARWYEKTNGEAVVTVDDAVRIAEGYAEGWLTRADAAIARAAVSRHTAEKAEARAEQAIEALGELWCDIAGTAVHHVDPDVAAMVLRVLDGDWDGSDG